MRSAIPLIVLFVSMGIAAGFAAEGETGATKASPSAQSQSPQTAEEKAIRASGEEFAVAFDKGDAKAIAALWTADCEYIDEDGRAFRGRDAIEKEYARFFATNPGLKIEISIASVKIMGGGAAIEEGSAIVKNVDGTLVSKGSYTAVQVKEGDKWLLASVRERAALSLSERPTLKDLEWLIGDWAAEKGSKTVEFRFQWIAGKKFMEFSYEARDKGNVARSGIQIIGCDPLSGDIISWSFDSTGGYGRGHWRLLKRGLTIESRGLMADGAPTAATEIVSKNGGDSFTWKSVNRSVAGNGLNDSDAVVMKRKPK